VLPWGVGCSIVYNDVDLVVPNDTATTFQLLVTVGERHLEGDLRSDAPAARSFKVDARDEEFIRSGAEIFRRNEIWRTVIDKRTGRAVGEELLKRNCALVRYEPTGPVIDMGPAPRRERHDILTA
jgi:vancomycin resistance protein VanW